jgi:hypothetical protein
MKSSVKVYLRDTDCSSGQGVHVVAVGMDDWIPGCKLCDLEVLAI